MVYRGPRQGCVNCRLRRRKCDNGEPACSVCMRTNQVCIRVEHALDAILRDQTAKVSDRVERQQAIIQRKSKSLSPGGHSRHAPLSVLRFAIPKLNPDMRTTNAASWFLLTHAPEPDDLESCSGYMEFLRPMYIAAPSDSPIVNATNALAVMLDTAWSGHYIDIPRNRGHLIKALNSVNKALSDPQESLKDSTLVAVLLLDLHDSFSNMVQTRLPTEIHFNGVMTLMKHRGCVNYETETSRRLTNAVRHQVLNYANTKGIAIEEATDLWRAEENEVLPRNKATELDDLCLRLNRIHVQIRALAPEEFSSVSGALSAGLYDVFKEAKALQHDLEQWNLTIPQHWRPLQVVAAADFDSYRETCHIYFDLGSARVINEYRLSRIKVLTWLIKMTSMRGGFWCEQNLHARGILQIVLDDFCDSVPFFIGNKYTAEAFNDPGIVYPGSTGNLERNRKNAMQATAFGGTLLLGSLRGILDSIKSSQNLELPLLHDDQLIWLRRQMLRIAVMYEFRLDPDDFGGAIPPLVARRVTPEAQKSPAMEKIGVGWNFRL